VRIALDGTPLALTSGGLVRYTAELTAALRREFPQDEYVLVSDQPFETRSGRPRNRLERFWWTWGIERELSRQGASLFHGVNFSVPYLALRPSVLTIHDLSPWMNPAWHRGAQRVRRRTPFLIGLGLATMLVTDTEAVRAQVIDRFGVHPGRVAAIHLAAAPQFQPVPPPERDPYLLFAGTLEPRKNVPALIESWREVRRRCSVDLVLAGRRRSDFPELAPEPGLHVLGEVSDYELAALYAGALLVVYPSAYEGFGLPLLEAMQCGACVVASYDPALVEVAGGAAVHAAPRDLPAALLPLLRDEGLRREYRARALARARDFSWRRTARRTREVYDQAWSRFYA
jgi:glycosyltransferase involved in cell wall biosynthesis